MNLNFVCYCEHIIDTNGHISTCNKILYYYPYNLDRMMVRMTIYFVF
jgi:hypothetical protein